MPYTAEKPRLAESTDQLRARIPGWGVDLDPADRPAFPRERVDPKATGAHWDLPEQQPEHAPRERSIEHLRLTPVFGTSAPLHGVAGAIRRHAYDRYGEGRAAHWLLLILGDRVDSLAHAIKSFGTLRPDNPITETGVLSEVTAHGIRSRVGTGRADLNHQWIDPLLIGAPWVAGTAAAVWLARKAAARARHRQRTATPAKGGPA